MNRSDSDAITYPIGTSAQAISQDAQTNESNFFASVPRDHVHSTECLDMNA